MGPPLRSFAADAHGCIMVLVPGPAGYKVVARIDPRPESELPSDRHPDRTSVPSCSEQSRYGLARAEHAARLVRRPTLTAPARDDMGEARVGTKERLSDRTKKLMRRCAGVPKLLDKKSPIQGASGSNREAESTDAPERGGLPCSSDEAGVMLVERRGQVIAVGSESRCMPGSRLKPADPHTTYLPATPCGVGLMVFRLKVPISHAESNFRYTGGTTCIVLYPAFKGGQL